MPDSGDELLIRALIEAAIEWRFASGVDDIETETQLIEAIENYLRKYPDNA